MTMSGPLLLATVILSFLASVGTVAFGVLLDTGRWFWWPGRLLRLQAKA